MKLEIELDSAYITAVPYALSSFKSNKNDEIELKYELSECLED